MSQRRKEEIDYEYSVYGGLRKGGVIYENMNKIGKERLDIFFYRYEENVGYLNSDKMLLDLFALTWCLSILTFILLHG